jgi:transposase
LKVAVQVHPQEVGIDVATWNWKGVRQFIEARVGRRLSRPTCLRYLHRLGFVCKRPTKRLLKAAAAKRAAFVEEYARLLAEAQASGAKLFFVDEAHFRADADLRRKWVLKGQPALVDSTSPRWGEKASYSSAVCLETGEVAVMELEGNSNAATSAAFLQQLRATQLCPLIVIWDNGPAHGGDEIRAFLATPDVQLRVVRLPAYSPDFNADEQLWAWAREEVTANTCLGTKAKVQEKLAQFFAGLAARADEVKRRGRTELQAAVEALESPAPATVHDTTHEGLICAFL